MIRVLLVSAVLVLGAAACAASNPKPNVAKGESCSRWEGQSCTHDAECFTLWCVNGACARREP